MADKNGGKGNNGTNLRKEDGLTRMGRNTDLNEGTKGNGTPPRKPDPMKN